LPPLQLGFIKSCSTFFGVLMEAIYRSIENNCHKVVDPLFLGKDAGKGTT